ncbi:hypothetical protein GAIMETA21S03_29760 [Phocaeicola vulgatus]|nr:hypothetical protein GAIMETA21S03_29760 [Phocaeicola vulgatus]
MPPLLPDEATKAQETFRLGDRFYVEEHGVGSGRTIHKFETISIYVQRRCQRNIL